jgi:hypothetical protein
MSKHSYVSNGRNWISQLDGSVAPWDINLPPEGDPPFTIRGGNVYATQPVRHQRSGEEFQQGTRLGRIERDRNGRRQLVLRDGSVRKL